LIISSHDLFSGLGLVGLELGLFLGGTTGCELSLPVRRLSGMLLLDACFLDMFPRSLMPAYRGVHPSASTTVWTLVDKTVISSSGYDVTRTKTDATTYIGFSSAKDEHLTNVIVVIENPDIMLTELFVYVTNVSFFYLCYVLYP